jgi:peptide/nickel transport system substrate-binding protein
MRAPAWLVVVGVLAGLACTAKPAAVDPPPRKTRLVVATTVEPDVLSPFLTESAAAREVLGLVARDLVVTDPSWTNVPDLAAAVPAADARGEELVVTWRIRGDARWEDGAPVVADDFVLGWRVQKDEAQETVTGRDDALRIASMVPSTDGRSFTVTWKEPNPFFAEPRVHRPLPAHVLAARLVDGEKLKPLKDDPLTRQPLSNGPFRLVEHVPGQHLLFARNESFSPRARLDEVLVTIAPSTSSALTMLQSGDVHAILPAAGPSPVEAKAFVDAHPGFVLETTPGQVWAHIDMNLDDAWLKDVRVRRALAAAIPRKQIFDAISGGLYELADTYLPPRHWGHADTEPLSFDPALAKKLLDEAGWKTIGDDGVRRNARGERLSLELAAASGQPETEQLLLLVKKALLDVGVELRLDLRPFKVFFGEGARKRKLPHLAFYAWTLDGASMGGALWRKDRIPDEENGWKGQNLPGWRNDEVTTLLTKADATLDVNERKRMLARVQELYRQELPAIPMYFRPVVVVHAKGVTGLVPTGTQTPVTWNAWAWDMK